MKWFSSMSLSKDGRGVLKIQLIIYWVKKYLVLCSDSIQAVTFVK